MADTHTYKFNVSMSCSGCSGAVDRVLKRLDGKRPDTHHHSHLLGIRSASTHPDLRSHLPSHPGPRTKTTGRLTRTRSAPHTGVDSYEVSLENQTATVVAKPDLAYEKVLQTIAKTGKKVNSGEADGVAQSVEVSG